MRRDLSRIYRHLPLVLVALIVIAALSGCGGKGGGY
jgi:predicted small lipoprotein YifL